jgi:23S rRNA pseudouridine2605 synthase
VEKDDPGKGLRLQKYLSMAGVCSRRHGEEAILRGEVSVDGKPAVLGMRIFPGGQVVTFCGEEVRPGAARRRTVLALNKPRGYICTHSDPLHRAEETIYALLPLYNGCKLICCGRLDKDSEGLVLLTDDGNLASRLMHPSCGVGKHYRVAIDQPLQERHREVLLKGIHDQGDLLTLEALSTHSGDRKFLSITLGFGKKRHIRRMLGALGYAVVRLERNKIGSFSLDGIRPGRYFHLEEKHIAKLLTPESRPRRKKNQPWRSASQVPRHIQPLHGRMPSKEPSLR